MPRPAALLIATGNAGKVREFRQMLDDRVPLLDLADVPAVAEVAETGRTFRANACLKAAGYAVATGHYALADDSGLAVDALGGRPGVHSARWAAMNAAGEGDGANNALLLSQLADVPDDRRAAHFACVLAVADPASRILFTAGGTMPGRVLREPRGTAGFGYDSLFLPDGSDLTTAQLSPAAKHAISHRGQALRRLGPLLDGWLNGGVWP